MTTEEEKRAELTRTGGGVMAKTTLPIVGALVIGLAVGSKYAVADEHLLDVVADRNGKIIGVLDGEGKDLIEEPFVKVEGVSLRSTKSLLFSNVNPSCCKRGGNWRLTCTALTMTRFDQNGQVVKDYNFVNNAFVEVATTDMPVHPSAVMYRDAQNTYELAIVEKNAKLYGLIMTPQGTVWHDEELPVSAVQEQ
jgi:hypothetical protein